MMLYKNNVNVCSLDGARDFFDIVAGLLQGDTLAPYLFIICLDNVRRTSIDLMYGYGFTVKKKHEADRHPQKLLWTLSMDMTNLF